MAGITLETAKRHLDAWLEAELAVTNAQSYTIGSRTMTKANLIEHYRDFDSTGDGHKAADKLELSADDLYRDARFAIRDIIGQSHTTVELI